MFGHVAASDMACPPPHTTPCQLHTPQAATLDLASALRPGGDYTVNWVKLSTRGHVPSARASCASALLAGASGCSAGLLIHGGVLCSPSVQVSGTRF